MPVLSSNSCVDIDFELGAPRLRMTSDAEDAGGRRDLLGLRDGLLRRLSGLRRGGRSFGRPWRRDGAEMSPVPRNVNAFLSELRCGLAVL